MDFSDALKALRDGSFVRSPNWGKSAYVKRDEIDGDPCLVFTDRAGHAIWYPVQADFFACDWEAF